MKMNNLSTMQSSELDKLIVKTSAEIVILAKRKGAVLTDADQDEFIRLIGLVSCATGELCYREGASRRDTQKDLEGLF